MSRNKNGLIHKRTCSECDTPTRTYKIVCSRKFEWDQAKRQWLPITKTLPVCDRCINNVKHLDTTLYIANPELERR